MSIKYFCDICSTEIPSGEFRQDIEIMVHISQRGSGNLDIIGYGTMIGGKMHSISGRSDKFLSCLPCYNRVTSKTFDEIEAIKSETTHNNPPPPALD